MNEDSRLDLLTVSSQARGELVATRALIEVEIEAKSRLRGDGAESAAREVEDLRRATEGAGVAREDVELVDVKIDHEQGLLLRSSTARYRLRITCREPERIGALIGWLAELDDLTLTSTSWRFDDESDLIDRLLEEATRRARTRGERMAQALGQELGGLHRLEYQVRRGGREPVLRAMPMASAGAGRAGTPSTAFDALGGERREDLEIGLQAHFHLR